MRHLLEWAAHDVGLAKPLFSDVLRRLCAPLRDGHLARRSDHLMGYIDTALHGYMVTSLHRYVVEFHLTRHGRLRNF